MKAIPFFFFLIVVSVHYSQNDERDWVTFSYESTVTIEIDRTDVFEINDLRFDVVWDKQLTRSDKIGYHGGIKNLTIYKGNKKLQVIQNIEDNIALGVIYFNFYDFNLDGNLDFTIPINSRWKMYFIFNPQTNQFEHREDWDYLRIQKIDIKKKQILSQQDGNTTEDNRKLFQIKGVELIELK